MRARGKGRDLSPDVHGDYLQLLGVRFHFSAFRDCFGARNALPPISPSPSGGVGALARS